MSAYVQDDDRTFDEMWAKAQADFADKTKRSLKKNYTLESATQFLNQRYNSPEADPDTESTKRRVLNGASNIISFLHLLAGIAAQGAAVVFPGAGMCFNALELLISVPAKISKVYDGIADLFQKIDTFLRQFKIYKRVEHILEADREFKYGVNMILLKFVDICALSVKLLDGGTWRTFKTGFKAAFANDDSGVGSALAEFERLINQHSQISDAVALEHVVKSSGAIKEVYEKLTEVSNANEKRLASIEQASEIIVNDVVDRTAKEKNEEQINTIIKGLATTREIALGPSKDFEQLRQDSVEGTGNWLLKVPEYQSWKDAESSNKPILLLQGDKGVGKSNIISAVGSMLKSDYQAVEGKSKRVAVAYYAFMRNNNKTNRDGSGTVVTPSTSALKSMATQIANQEKLYAKDLIAHLEHKDPSFSRDLRPEQLCKELFLPPSSNEVSDAIYFLLFDDLDQIPDDDAKRILEAIIEIDSPKIRVMVSITNELINRVFESNQGHSRVSTIECKEHNKPDIAKYIESLLKDTRMPQGSTAIEKRVLAHIKENLPSVADGSFANVKQILGEVCKACEDDLTEEEIMAKVSLDVVKKESNQAMLLLSELNQTLSENEILFLNDLLAWIVYAPAWMSTDELRAVRFLRTGREPTRSMEDQLKNNKFADLFNVSEEGETVKLSSDAMEQHFRQSERTENRVSKDKEGDPYISMEIKIHRVKRSQIQRFFWDIGERVAFDKFSFDDQLEAKTSISAVESSSLLLILDQCFKLLDEKPRDETKALFLYATDLLPYVLSDMRDCVTELDVPERANIVRHLVEVLRYPGCIEQKWTERFIQNSYWRSQDALEAIWAWLRDDEARAGLSSREKAWIEDIMVGPKMGVIKNVSTIIARKLFCSRDKFLIDLFYWIESVIENEKEPNTESQEERDLDDNTTGLEKEDTKMEQNDDDNKTTFEQRIEGVINWAIQELHIKEKNSLFFERVGQLYLEISKVERAKGYELALQAFQKAFDLPDTHWAVFEGLAESYGNKDSAIKNLSKALEMADKAVNMLSTQPLACQEEIKAFSRLSVSSAKYCTELHEPERAIAYLSKAVEAATTVYDSHFELMKLLVREGKSLEALQMLLKMKDERVQEKNVTHLQNIIQDFTRRDELETYLEVIFNIAKGDDLLSQIVVIINDQLKDAQNKNETNKVARLLLSQGMAIAACGGDQEIAARTWKDCCEVGFKGDWDTYNVISIAGELAIKYHYSQRQETRSGSDLEIHLEEVRKLADGATVHFPALAENFRLALGGFYTQLNQRDQARKVLLQDLVLSLNLLTDEDDKNDLEGLLRISNVLMHLGDELGSLSAWSLLGPREQDTKLLNLDGKNDEHAATQNTANAQVPRIAERVGDLNYICDGRCGKLWTYADDMWICKLCPEVGFCLRCLLKLKNSTLGGVKCDSKHDWIHVPPWSDGERGMVGKGNVMVGGSIVETKTTEGLIDRKRIGGRVVSLDTWLDMIRTEWEIENPTKANSRAEEVEEQEV